MIKVLDKRVFKDSVIGLYVFDLSHIYFKKNHAIINQWIALSNPSADNFNEISGYLKVSISVIGSQDDQINLTEMQEDQTEESMIVVPPHISIQYY